MKDTQKDSKEKSISFGTYSGEIDAFRELSSKNPSHYRYIKTRSALLGSRKYVAVVIRGEEEHKKLDTVIHARHFDLFEKRHIEKRKGILVEVSPRVAKEIFKENSIEKFHPSLVFLNLLRTRIITTTEAYRSILDKINTKQIEEVVSFEVESLLTSLAKRNAPKKNVQITQDKRFTPEICLEIIERFDLDPYDARPVLDKLYEELIDFSSYTRKRKWGEIVKKNSELVLKIYQGAFKIPNLNNDDLKWTTI